MPDTAITCQPCMAYLGECWDPEQHTDRVRNLARLLAGAVFQHEDITDVKVGWFMEDATVIVRDFDDDVAEFTVVDLGVLADERKHFTVNGKHYAEPDPNAEGFNPCELMAPCDHPYGDEPDFRCELCHGSNWMSQGEANFIAAQADSGRGEA